MQGHLASPGQESRAGGVGSREGQQEAEQCQVGTDVPLARLQAVQRQGLGHGLAPQLQQKAEHRRQLCTCSTSASRVSTQM